MRNFSQFGTVLTREESKKIRGGSGTCGAISPSGSILCNVSKDTALWWKTDEPGGWWCCESCGTSSYCG